GAADLLAHGALGDLFEHAHRVLGTEQEHLRIGHAVQHVERHGDDVLVAGQHRQAVGEGAHAGGVDLDHGFDRPWRLEVGARLHHAGDLAEAQHHAALLFADQHEAVENQPHHQRDADPAQRAPAATAAAEQAAQAITEIAQATTAATALGRPGITAVAAGARTFGPLAVV